MASLLVPAHAAGIPVVVNMSVKLGVTVEQFDFVVQDGDGDILPAAAGQRPCGVALGRIPTASAADGAFKLAVDVSRETLYWRAVGTGTATIAMRGKSCDVAGAATVDVTASTDDNILIHDVDATNNRVLCSLIALPLGVA